MDISTSVILALSADLLKPSYRFMADPTNPTSGHCYHAAEAAYHLLGGKPSGFVPQVHRGEDGITHWWLRRGDEIIDPTADQYLSVGEQPPYALGRGCGFMTSKPSRPAAEIIRRVKEADQNHSMSISTTQDAVYLDTLRQPV